MPRGRDPQQHDDNAEPYLATATAASFATRDDELYICDRAVATAHYEWVNDGSPSLGELRQSLLSDAPLTTRLLSYANVLYDGQPVGALGNWGLPTGSEQLAITMGQLARAYSPDGTIGSPPALPAYMQTGDAVPADGLLAEYFTDTALGQLAVARPETGVGQAWLGCAPDPVLTPSAFSARWTGTVAALYTETYTFTAAATAPSGFGSTTRSSSTRGRDRPVGCPRRWHSPPTRRWPSKSSTRSPSSNPSIQLMWSSASQAEQPLPQDRLAPPAWPVIWSSEYVDPDYVDAFRAVLPRSAGYTYHRADPTHIDGYYSTTQHHYDVQDDPTGGRGLLVWQEDALGNRSTVAYDQPYALLPVQVTDAAQLIRSASYDYRVLKPSLVTDVNGNQTAASYSPLGLPAAIAAMGKPGEQVGDTIDHPGTWFTYDLSAYDDNPGNRQPLSVQSTKRVDHAWTLINAKAQTLGRPLTAAEIAALLPPDELDLHPERFMQRLDYSDGTGRLLQSRSHADQLIIGDLGLTADPGGQVQPVSVGQADDTSPQVVVSSWQAYDNKGRVVEKWEPFFAQEWAYQPPSGDQLAGLLRKVTTYYDARGLAVLTVHPDGSQQRVVPGIPADLATPGDLANPAQFTPTPWEVYTYDQNDEAGRTNPTTSSAWQSHWNTPSSALQDALGRVVESTRRTKDNATLVTRSSYDIEGNLLAVTDPLGRTASTAVYDLLKRAWRTELLDAGVVQRVVDPLGGPIEQRDSKGALTLTDFDALHRDRRRWACDGTGHSVTLRQLVVYGEAAGLQDPAAANLLGRAYDSYDEAGRQHSGAYDFQGNLLDKQRQVLSTALLLSALPPAGELVGHGPSGRLAAACHDDARRPGAGCTRHHAARRDHLRDEHRVRRAHSPYHGPGAARRDRQPRDARIRIRPGRRPGER